MPADDSVIVVDFWTILCSPIKSTNPIYTTNTYLIDVDKVISHLDGVSAYL